jgi:hypothetical protein
VEAVHENKYVGPVLQLFTVEGKKVERLFDESDNGPLMRHRLGHKAAELGAQG